METKSFSFAAIAVVLPKAAVQTPRLLPRIRETVRKLTVSAPLLWMLSSSRKVELLSISVKRIMGIKKATRARE